MEIKLWKKPKNVILIEGFPGFGLVGTIASEFLIDHLKTEMIGKITFEEMPAMVAIHGNKVIEPLGIFYSKQYNLIILHAITASSGFEWAIADTIKKLAKLVTAKEIISLEGVGSGAASEEPSTFYFAKKQSSAKKLEKAGLKPLNEGIIMGVTGALLLKLDTIPLNCIFAETHSDLPDSKAAAGIIKALDKYLGLKIDPKPLIDQAEKFEEKLKSLMKQGQQTVDAVDKKQMSYVG